MAELWLHVKVKLLIKSISLICIMNCCKIYQGLKDPAGPFLSLLHWGSPSLFISVTSACIHQLSATNSTRSVYVSMCVASETGWRSTAVSGSTGSNLLLFLFSFAEQLYTFIRLVWIFRNGWQPWRLKIQHDIYFTTFFSKLEVKICHDVFQLWLQYIAAIKDINYLLFQHVWDI